MSAESSAGQRDATTGAVRARRLTGSALAAALLGVVGCSSSTAERSLVPATTTTVALRDQIDVAEPALVAGDASITVGGAAVMYRFDGGATLPVPDRSGEPEATPLVAADPELVEWVDDGLASLLVLPGGSLGAALTARLGEDFDGEASLELWIDPTDRPGVVGTVATSDGTLIRVAIDEQLTLRAEIAGLELDPSADGSPPIVERFEAPLGASPGLTQVVVAVTRQASWLFVDGLEVGTGRGAGVEFAPTEVRIGEVGGGWSGSISYLGLYRRAIVGAEVADHHAIGPRGLVSDGPVIVAMPDSIVRADDQVRLDTLYYDPTGDPVTFEVISDMIGLSSETDEDTFSLLIDPTEDDVGEHLVIVEASAGGKQVATTVLVTVVPGRGSVEQLLTAESVAQDGTSLNDPLSIDAYGESLLIADADGNRIYEYGDGVLRTVAGSGVAGFAGDGGAATEALIFEPSGVAALPGGGFVFTDRRNHRIRMVDPAGIISTIGGIGVPGSGGDGGPAIDAALFEPSGVVVSPAGEIYVADVGNHRIRRINPDGTIETYAGSGVVGVPIDGQHRTLVDLDDPTRFALAPDGTLYVSDAVRHYIWRIDPEGFVWRVVGTGVPAFSGDGGPAIDAGVFRPRGIVVAADGTLYFADAENHRIRRIRPDGTISTVAGNGSDRWTPGSASALGTGMTPNTLVLLPNGDLLFCDRFAVVLAVLTGLSA